jgi:LacI family transcriptional regulator
MHTATRIEPSEPCRIAVVWQMDWMQTQETFNALCRRADAEPGMSLRYFNAAQADFGLDVLRPLAAWRPHGMVVRVLDEQRLRRLRRRFPGIPLVAPYVAPPEMVDTRVTADIAEICALARDHFHSRGVRQMALFCIATATAAPGRVEAFRSAVPGGFEQVYAGEEGLAFTNASRAWLQSLPKPVGILAPEAGAAQYLLSWCRDFKLRVPRDVQVIGVDDADECLSTDPHMTSVSLPSVRIGEVTLETVLRHVRGGMPRPPPLIPVAGSVVIARGSTGLQPVGRTALSGAMRMMQTQARRGVTAERIARQAGVGLTTFYRQFGAATGSTPARHLRRLRLEEACRMLRETRTSVSAIAAASGFNSVYSFTRCFRRELGQTPTAYRKRKAGGGMQEALGPARAGGVRNKKSPSFK